MARLPQGVLANFRRANSENAILWNAFYNLYTRGLRLSRLLTLKPLWGTPLVDGPDEPLVPYFWGIGPDGDRLPGLDGTLDAIDGAGPRTEVDLFLMGPTSLTLIEAKNLSTAGRCRRYLERSCPEIHLDAKRWLERCRYWEADPSRFEKELAIGARPGPGTSMPPCDVHYQLARTLMVGRHLTRETGRQLHLWMILPRSRWRANESTWLDFVERIRDPDLWRRTRVVAWEDLVALPAHPKP